MKYSTKRRAQYALVVSFLLCSMLVRAESPRLVTVGGAITEIVYALGAEQTIVGTDTTSYYPAQAESLPKVGYMRALSAEGILSLRPTLVLLSAEAGPPAVLHQLENSGVETVVMEESHSLEGVYHRIGQVAEVLSLQPEGAQLIARLQSEMKAVASRLAEISERPRVLFLLQNGGGAPMVAGRDTAADAILALAGAKNGMTDYSGYKPLTPEAVVSASPEVLLVTSQSLEQLGGKRALARLPGMALTPAVREDRIIVMDSLLLLGFGPRTPQAALTLVEALSPHSTSETAR